MMSYARFFASFQFMDDNYRPYHALSDLQRVKKTVIRAYFTLPLRGDLQNYFNNKHYRRNRNYTKKA